jgi:hypothetical protein
MKKYRGFYKNLHPLMVFSLDLGDDLTQLKNDVVILNHPVLLQISLDRKENFIYLSDIVNTFKDIKNVWFGIQSGTGFEESKIERAIKAYEMIRNFSLNKIVIEAFRTDGTCSKLIFYNKKLENVDFSLPFEIHKTTEVALQKHVEKIELIKEGCGVDCITFFPNAPKKIRGGCGACQSPELSRMKKMIENMNLPEVEKQKLLTGIEKISSEGDQEAKFEEQVRQMLKYVNENNLSWYAEDESALFEGCFQKASQKS